jgi:superfamily I DNA/RNA helicase
MFDPTAQQVAILEAARTGDNLVVIAVAGSGKTSTLRLLGADRPAVPMLYVAYNKAIQLDAQGSFTRNVECRTAHSLAWGATVGKYGNRVRKARMGALPVKDVQEFLKLYRPFDWTFATDTPALEGKELAELVARTIGRFVTSADFEVTRRHVMLPVGLPDQENTLLADKILELARRVWDDLHQVQGRLTFNPDIYLKLWQLSRPVLRKYKVIFLDEAQDANRAMADVFERQTHAQLIAVGDPCQEIYGWRGAANAMSRWDWPRLGLTKSFRFGPAIAAQANRWLDFLDAEMRVEGYDKLASRVLEPDQGLDSPDAILCRTNIGVVDAALGQLTAGRKVAVCGGIGEVVRLARAAINLRAGRRANHPDLAAFRSWDEFLAFVANDPDGEQYRVLVAMVEIYGPDEILNLGNRLTTNEADADVTISTGHKSKGREWDEVVIGPDFAPRDSDSEDDPTPAFTREAAMLAYVCTTRAKLVLDPGPLGDVPV